MENESKATTESLWAIPAGLATGMEVGQYPSVGRAAKPKPSGWEWEESDIGAAPARMLNRRALVAAPGAAGTTPKLVA
jgi:hypothetical protein